MLRLINEKLQLFSGLGASLSMGKRRSELRLPAFSSLGSFLLCFFSSLASSEFFYIIWEDSVLTVQCVPDHQWLHSEALSAENKFYGTEA